MPRKTNKREKPPLQFRERPVGRANLHIVPEVRAALNPKEYFTENTSSSSLASWVSPQFDTSIPLAPRGRGRRPRACVSAASLLEVSTPVTRKKTVCKFSPLSFESKQSHGKDKEKKKNTDVAAESRRVQSKEPSETTRRKPRSVAAAPSKRWDASPPTKSSRPRRAPSASKQTNDPEVMAPAPELRNSSDSVRVLMPATSPLWSLMEPGTPPCSQASDVLVANTPERQYGVKVTWRRREELMVYLKKKGHLSDSDVQMRN